MPSSSASALGERVRRSSQRARPRTDRGRFGDWPDPCAIWLSGHWLRAQSNLRIEDRRTGPVVSDQLLDLIGTELPGPARSGALDQGRLGGIEAGKLLAELFQRSDLVFYVRVRSPNLHTLSRPLRISWFGWSEGFLDVRGRSWVIRFNAQSTVPAGAFLERLAPAHRTSSAAFLLLPGSTGAVVPSSRGDRGSSNQPTTLACEAVRGRLFTGAFCRGALGYGLRVALCQRRCRSANSRVSTSGATCE
jgi:hypothetical protein